MTQSRLSRIRRWHTRRVLTPFPIRVEGARYRSHFLAKLEARWSASRRTWLWRVPFKQSQTAAEQTI